MDEAEWKTRRDRIDKRLRFCNPPWEIIPYRAGLDCLQLTCHAVSEFPTEQMQWLSLIREHLVKNLSMDEEDFDLTPLLEMRGGKAKARKVFNDLPSIVVELNTAVAV